MSNIKKKILKIILDDKLYIFCLLSLLILFGLRIFNLDCDLPPFGIAYYQTIDEGLYSKISINLYKYNNLYTTGEFPLYIAPNYRANIVGNIFQYLTLKIFGNNYYGFRIPYVIMALISFLLIFMTVKEISIRYGLSIIKTRLFSIFFLMYVLIDFSYLLMSRCVENSNIRVLTIVLSIYLFIKLKSQYKYFMLSFIGIISIFFVYFSNIVILVGAGFLFIYAMIQKDWEKCKSIIIQYLGGILLGFIVTEIYYLLVWKEGALTNLISAVFDFSDRINVSQSTGLLKNMVKGVFLFLNSNMFFYSFSFLVVSLLALIFNLFYAIKKNDEIMLLVNIIIVLGIV